MLCGRVQLSTITNVIKNSLQANISMFPPAQNDTPDRRVSFCTSPGNKGSLTVEAAFVVPLFFLAVVMLISLMDMMRIQSRVTASLHESAKTLGMYGYLTELSEDGALGYGLDTALGVAYAAAQLPQESRADISLAGSYCQNRRVYLKASGSYHFLAGLPGIRRVKFQAGAAVHMWTGYRPGEDGAPTEETEAMVYVAERRTVYHTHGDCTHLNVSMHVTDQQRVRQQRNEYGARYQPCPKCITAGTVGTLYITTQGDRYHRNADCSALRRSGMLVKQSEAAGLPLCSRCAKRGGTG